MQTSRNVGVTALLLGAFLLLSGCGTSDTNPTATPADVSEPLFASEEEALAAAEEVFAAYLDVNDTVFQEGGAGPERLSPFVTEAWLKEEVASMEKMAAAGRRQVGDSSFDRFELQQLIEEDSTVTIMVNVCLDLRDVAIVDSHDNNVGNAAPRVPLEATFVSPTTGPSLRMSGLEPWSNTEYC